MRVLLVNPPVQRTIQAELPFFIGRSVGIFPPLGLMYLASYLKDHNAGCQIEILDCIADRLDTAATLDAVSRSAPDIVGITTHTQNLLDVTALIRGIKKIDSNIHVTLGGPHATIFPDESIGIEGVDTVVAGQGEEIFSCLVDCLVRNDDLKKIRGIFFKEKGYKSYTRPHVSSALLDDYPFPERNGHGLDIRKYRYALNQKGGLMTTMISGRGCDESCIFCSTPHSPLRKRSPANIAEEMEQCAQLGFKEIHFVDDTFNAELEHASGVCREIRRRKLPLSWSIRARADKLTKELCEELKESGCCRIQIGVETSTDKGLKMLRKGITVAQVKNAFFWAKKSGLVTVAYFMLGCPHEKEIKDVVDTIDFSLRLDPDYAMFNLLTPYPRTPLYKEAIRKKIIKEDVWQDFCKNPSLDFQIPCWEEWLSRKELKKLLNQAYRKFYCRPKFIIKTVRVGIDLLKGAHCSR